MAQEQREKKAISGDATDKSVGEKGGGEGEKGAQSAEEVSRGGVGPGQKKEDGQGGWDPRGYNVRASGRLDPP